MAESQPSGVRLVFQTMATAVELVVLADQARLQRHWVPVPMACTTCSSTAAWRTRAASRAAGCCTSTWRRERQPCRRREAQALRFSGLPGEGKSIELWLPHDEVTELVALRSDAALFPVAASGKRRWVHHGSSISQGSNTTHPSGTWPAVAPRAPGLDLLNLGYSGNALLDPFAARSIRELPADLISVKIGINLVNKDLMRLRAFGPAVHGFLDTIREGHPSTPLLVVSPIFCPIHEACPGRRCTTWMRWRKAACCSGGRQPTKSGKAS
jgi:hypothetical protein